MHYSYFALHSEAKKSVLKKHMEKRGGLERGVDKFIHFLKI